VAQIVLDEVSKVFGRDVVAVDRVSLEIADGEFMVLVGPSGCGKSTLLRIVAGLEEPTGGEVIIGDRVVTDMAPRDRDVAMVFQNYALYPHMTVEQNLGIGLKVRHTAKDETRRRVAEVARILGLESLLDRKPGQLSGGQRQRVAIGRAMVREPLAFLMDEPLSNLDAKLRVQMRAELARLRDTLHTTTVYVTHDQVEAMTLGDRVAVMKDGVVQQLDTPQALYWTPANLFVAAFIGSPAMNLVEAHIDDGMLRFGSSAVPVPAQVDPHLHAGRHLALGIRPSDLEDASLARDDSLPVIQAVVDVTEELGSEVNVHFTLDCAPVDTEQTRAVSNELGFDTDIPLMVDAGRTRCIARVDARSRAGTGDVVSLTVDPERIYLFDRDTGEVISTPQRTALRA
jgi:multiple sugar transport system ATP-binding protein